MLERHRALSRIDIGRYAAEHRLVDGRVERDPNAGGIRGADEDGEKRLRGRAELVGDVAAVAVEILFDHELAMACNEDAVDLQRAERIDRRIDQHLDEALDRIARDADRFERRDGPAIGELQRWGVAIARGGAAAGIEG